MDPRCFRSAACVILPAEAGKKARVTCDTLLICVMAKRWNLKIDDGATVVVQAGQAPIVDGVQEERMRVGCGSATIGMFAKQWLGKVDEVVVVDDHITGVLSEHQAGKLLGMPRNRDQDERPAIDAGALFSRLPNRDVMGRNEY